MWKNTFTALNHESCFKRNNQQQFQLSVWLECFKPRLHNTHGCIPKLHHSQASSYPGMHTQASSYPTVHTQNSSHPSLRAYLLTDEVLPGRAVVVHPAALVRVHNCAALPGLKWFPGEEVVEIIATWIRVGWKDKQARLVSDEYKHGLTVPKSQIHQPWVQLGEEYQHPKLPIAEHVPCSFSKYLTALADPYKTCCLLCVWDI